MAYLMILAGLAFNSFPGVDRLLKTRRDTRTVRFIGICRCVGIRQIASARSNFYLAVRVPGISRQNRWIVKTDFTPVNWISPRFNR
jgi:hypothetical protein